jgi:hypothetical protein
VQQALTAVVAELAERYGHHASFGGVGVHLSADSYALLPDETCSLDEVTFERFLTDTKNELKLGSEPPFVARWTFIRSKSAQQSWLDWRAEKMANLYRQMRDQVVRRRAGAKLYLTTANLLGGRQLQTALKPELPAKDSVAEVLPLLGLDLSRFDDKDIVIPRPKRIVPTSSPHIRAQEQHWNRNESLDSLFARTASGSTLHFLLPAPLRLPDFDAASPFGADKTRTLLISHMAPADAANRERFVESLARLDASLMIDGGWLLPLGQESALAPFAKVYRRLPAEPFQTAKISDPPQELVVRTLAKGDKTYFYAVNPTPWPLVAQIQFGGPQSLRLLPYCDDRQATFQPNESGASWTIEMEPFDLVGGELSGGRAKVNSWAVTLPPPAAQALVELSRDIANRTFYLRDHPHPLEVVNPSFEIGGADGTASGWISACDRGMTGARDRGMVVEVDRVQGSNSASSLHLASRGASGPVWIRSSPLATPTTGRIRMAARVRISDPSKQPQLRLAIEGKLEGQVYYRRVNVGSQEREGDDPAPPLGIQWATYSISRVDLPVSGLTDLRVGFDLMSEGEVWIDEVQVQDLWLQDEEYNELFKSAPTANLQAQSGRLNECRLFVEGYWPSFLRRHVQLPDVKENVLATAGAAAEASKPPITVRPAWPAAAPVKEAGKKPNWLERTAERNKSWWPSWMKLR